MKFSLICLLLIAMLAAPGIVSADEATINLRRTTTVEVVERTKHAVVYISSKRLVAEHISRFPNDPFFRNFGQTVIRPRASLGSGFIVHPDGYIVTNNHVIDRARQIIVELLDGRKFDAEIVSAIVEADLAVLKIKTDKPLPTLPLGDSSDLLIGEPVIAVGNPLGFSNSVSTGIVAAVHRDLTAGNEELQLTDLIQTDAAINPGNSGGPLLNAYGQVIGINTAIRGDAQNIGFAIQVNRLRELIPELMNPAIVTRLDIPLKLVEKRELTPPAGIVATVHRESDGAAVLSIAGRKPATIIDAYATLLAQREGQEFTVEFAGQSPMKITPRPVPLPDVIVKARERLGIGVQPITPMIAERLQLPTEAGLLVTEVLANSPAAKAGLQPGDVIRQIGPFLIDDTKNLSALFQVMPEHGNVRIGILRDGRQLRGILQL